MLKITVKSLKNMLFKSTQDQKLKIMNLKKNLNLTKYINFKSEVSSVKI